MTTDDKEPTCNCEKPIEQTLQARLNMRRAELENQLANVKLLQDVLDRKPELELALSLLKAVFGSRMP